MPNNLTVIADLIDPEVLADMISAKVEARVMALPYARFDDTLEGRPGDTITIPRYGYSFGDAVEVAEGADIPLRALETDTVQYQIKKVGIGGAITDEALLSGYGDPMGEMVKQIAMAVTNKLDGDTIEELYSATTTLNAQAIIGYEPIVNAIDLFEEEINAPKVIFVHPKQVTQLRKDENFISADKYKEGVTINGEIGTICNAKVIPSRKVVEVTYEKDNAASGSNVVTISAANLEEYQAKVDPAVKLAAGDKVKPATAYYLNPIIRLAYDPETEDATPALTFFIKRNMNVETERLARSRKTEVTADEIYVVALTNENQVVRLRCLKQAAQG